MKKYILEIIVFVSGAVVMILEIVGTRILAPYFGTSIFVWTSMIGVILGSLSFGYWLGGKVADKRPDYKTFSLILFLSALSTGIINFIKSPLLGFLQQYVADIRWSSLLAAIILFVLPSVLLGMVSPYAVKLKIKDLNKSGSTVGNLYAISTVGSIVGTFLAGFFLIALLGHTTVIFILAITLIILSLLAYKRDLHRAKITLLLLFLISIISFYSLDNFYRSLGFIDLDTDYSRVWVFNSADKISGQPIRIMRVNNESDSAMFLNNNDLVFEYTKYYRLAKHFAPDLKSSLAIGAGAYSYPRDYLKNFPDSTIDTVEIDPDLTDLAYKYFNLKNDPRLTIYHADGRTFLNKNEKKYDAIFLDIYKSYSIPFQLASKEAVELIYNSLSDNGIVMANIVSALEGERGKTFRSEYLTYKDVFPQVYIFKVQSDYKDSQPQNLIILALKSFTPPIFKSDNSEFQGYLDHLWTKTVAKDVPILTDDFAPVDYYGMRNLF